jgi:hypothetical protein
LTHLDPPHGLFRGERTGRASAWVRAW